MNKTILIPYDHWRGGFLNQIAEGLSEKFTVIRAPKDTVPFFVKLFEKLGLFGSYVKKQKSLALDNLYVDLLKKNEINVFITISGGGFSINLLEKIKSKVDYMVSYVADDPFNPSPHRDQVYPLSLSYYDVLLVAEHAWIRNIRNVTKARVQYYHGGYSPDIWNERVGSFNADYKSDVLFTGASYKLNAEGLYRALIIHSLSDHHVKLWGDKGWLNIVNNRLSLDRIYQGERLEFSELFIALRSTKIYLNLPSPQIVSDFQPRVFELGAAGIFQICPYSKTLLDLFGESIVMFRDLSELEKLVKNYLGNPAARKEKAEELKIKIISGKYSWGESISVHINDL
jgi:hypothetical protein